MQAGLQYDSLSQVLNGAIAGKQFDLSEGIFKKHITVEKTWVSGLPDGQLQIEVNFSGSFNGTVLFTGKPTYNAVEKNNNRFRPAIRPAYEKLFVENSKMAFQP